MGKSMISLSIVLYNTKLEDIDNLRESIKLLKSSVICYIVDNSFDNSLRNSFVEFSNVEYIHNPSNPGFGASHNLAFKRAICNGHKYHFVINPDAVFTNVVIDEMVRFMESDKEIGMMMPEILNVDGSKQYLPKLLPSPLSIFLRKLKKPGFIYKPFIRKYELRDVPSNRIYEAPILSGCFTLFSVDAIEKIGGYDDNYFMYFEDWDISRRMHESFKTVYFPKVSIIHGYESGANKSARLFKIFIRSMIYYFNKWGWLFDKNRSRINKETLEQFKS